jgi:hypothetical protein
VVTLELQRGGDLIDNLTVPFPGSATSACRDEQPDYLEVVIRDQGIWVQVNDVIVVNNDTFVETPTGDPQLLARDARVNVYFVAMLGE